MGECHCIVIRLYNFKNKDMKISRIIIKKFRSIEKADVWIDSINAIVGQNNSGKSSLLRALNTFFNYSDEKPYFQSEVHSFGPRSVSKIEVHFHEIDEEVFEEKYIENGE
jgi:putative ATP-dependent endonuclease of OLD family